jgi:hypothetical protein
MRPKSLAAAVVLVIASLPAFRARAQDNSAAVEALFKQGKELAAAGNYSEACPKFLASYNLEHRVGTLLNLADCYERNGQIASAWARFVEASTLAARNNQPERVEFATKHATALEPRRSTLTIVVPQADSGLVVKRDGTALDAAILGVPVPVDGGPHTVEATAPGKVLRTDTVLVKAEGDNQVYTLAPLVDEPPKTGSPTAEEPSSESSHRGLKPRAIIGLAIAGVGVAAAGVGAYFGVTALSKNSDSSPYCGVGGVKNDCWGPGVSLRSDATSDATISTVLISAGAAAVVGGVVLWITTPSSKSAAGVGFDGRVLRLEGTF